MVRDHDHDRSISKMERGMILSEISIICAYKLGDLGGVAFSRESKRI